MIGAICPECHAGAHGQCIEQGCYCDCQMPDELDENFDVYDDGDEEWEFDCGIMYDRKGKLIGCSYAGSEDCDFECPNRNAMYQELDKRKKK